MRYCYSIEELDRYCANVDAIYLYGAGMYGRRMQLYLEQNGISVKVFIVSTSEKPSFSSIRDVPIIQLGKTTLTDKTKLIVCVSEKNQADIISALQKTGIKDYVCMTAGLYSELDNRIDYKAFTDVPNRKYIQVLTFHRVANKDYDPWLMSVPTDLFEDYVKYIKENYQILRFEEDWSGVNKKSLVLTFDDGYQDFYENAFPILKKYYVPATLFVCTENIGTEKEFWYDRLTRVVPESERREKRDKLKHMLPEDRERELQEIEKYSEIFHFQKSPEDRTLSTNEIKELADSGIITIGAHTVYHGAIGSEPEEIQRYEIVQSKKALEDIIEKDITVFSYPFGQRDTYSDMTINILKEAGIKKAACTAPELAGADSPLYEIPRIGQAPRNLDVFVRDLEKKWALEGTDR